MNCQLLQFIFTKEDNNYIISDNGFIKHYIKEYLNKNISLDVNIKEVLSRYHITIENDELIIKFANLSETPIFLAKIEQCVIILMNKIEEEVRKSKQ